jgi:hypothetical protein
MTNYDRLVLDVETDGSVNPAQALSSAGATLRSLLFKAKQKKLDEALQRGEIVLDQAPVTHARRFLDALHTGEEGIKLVHYTGDYFIHRQTHYEEIEEATITRSARPGSDRGDTKAVPANIRSS